MPLPCGTCHALRPHARNVHRRRERAGLKRRRGTGLLPEFVPFLCGVVLARVQCSGIDDAVAVAREHGIGDYRRSPGLQLASRRRRCRGPPRRPGSLCPERHGSRRLLLAAVVSVRSRLRPLPCPLRLRRIAVSGHDAADDVCPGNIMKVETAVFVVLEAGILDGYPRIILGMATRPMPPLSRETVSETKRLVAVRRYELDAVAGIALDRAVLDVNRRRPSMRMPLV